MKFERTSNMANNSHVIICLLVVHRANDSQSYSCTVTFEWTHKCTGGLNLRTVLKWFFLTWFWRYIDSRPSKISVYIPRGSRWSETNSCTLTLQCHGRDTKSQFCKTWHRQRICWSFGQSKHMTCKTEHVSQIRSNKSSCITKEKLSLFLEPICFSIFTQSYLLKDIFRTKRRHARLVSENPWELNCWIYVDVFKILKHDQAVVFHKII